MNMATKKDIIREHLTDYLKGDKKKRGEITRHICFVTGIHAKSVPRAFRRVQMRSRDQAEERGRRTYYTPDATAALRQVWDAASEPCAENLHSVVPEYVRILKRDGGWKHTPEATDKLLSMSMGTMKNRVAGFVRKRFLVHGHGTTAPGAIHTLIPIRTGPWSDAPVGTMQIDTVAHCGDTVAGDFAYTVNSTDTATLWGERRAQWNKGQIVTVYSMERIEQQLPFPVCEWHPDSGSEFINWHCKEWCENKGQRLTRSRPSKKNDNCFVEERNGHIVRRWVGYARFDVPEIVEALNAVYDVLTPYCNHFVASRRVIKKERIGARWKITRERTAKTPYQRLLERNDVTDATKQRLKAVHESLNPLTMKDEIERRLKKVFLVQKQHGNRTVR
jgi:hypothetical protein